MARGSRSGRARNHRLRKYFLSVLVTLFLVAPVTGWANSDPIEPFIGVYSGIAVTDPSGILTPRDIGVEIRPEHGDFIVDWHSVITDGSSVRRRNHEVHFQRNLRHGGERGKHVYHEALRPSVSGTPRPSDPMQGEPYFWARIVDNTLTIYRMLITDDGSQDFQIYRFTLDGDQMHLDFKHMRDDRQLQAVTGVLEKRVNTPLAKGHTQ